MMDLVLISERLGDETTQNALVAAFGPVARKLRFSRAKNVGPQHQPGPPQRAVWEASISLVQIAPPHVTSSAARLSYSFAEMSYCFQIPTMTSFLFDTRT